jgi:hypothetical protein
MSTELYDVRTTVDVAPLLSFTVVLPGALVVVGVKPAGNVAVSNSTVYVPAH